MGITRSKEEIRESLKQQIKEFNERLQTSLIRSNQAKVTFITLTDIWTESRGEAIATLQTIASEIDRHHHNVNIANLTGTSSSIAGGAAAIGGLILSPFSGKIQTTEMQITFYYNSDNIYGFTINKIDIILYPGDSKYILRTILDLKKIKVTLHFLLFYHQNVAERCERYHSTLNCV